MIKIGEKCRLLNFRDFQIEETYTLTNLDGDISSYYMVPCNLRNSSNGQSMGVLILNESSSAPKRVRLRDSAAVYNLTAIVSGQVVIMIK